VDTAKYWDINQPQDFAGGLLQFPIQSNDYWWSSGANSLDLNAVTSGSFTASLTNRSLWTNQAGKSATDTTAPWTDWTGATVTLSPYEGFTKAMKNVKQVGLSFGNSCTYASGVALDLGPGAFWLDSVTVTP
jgi:hypothetical protein